MLKSTVLDPQGQTIHHALSSLGYSKIRQVRQGKFFVLELDDITPEQARIEVGKIAREVLANPVIEEFRYEILS